MENTTRKSRVYSYFYGAGTVFQQFLLLVGAMMIALSFAAQVSAEASADTAYKKYQVCLEEAEELGDVYKEIYYSLGDKISLQYEVEITETVDEIYKEEAEAYNEALDNYLAASEKTEEAYEKYSKKNSGTSVVGILLIIGGSLTAIVAVIWGIYKKLAFNKKVGEQAYDETLSIKIKEAKEKALEKINIVSEQIDLVEPVVLNGIAEYNSFSNAVSIGRLTKLFSKLFNFIFEIKTIVLGAIAGAIFFGISMLFAQFAFFIPLVAFLAIAVYAGLKLYKTYEVESYVSPSTIEKLNKLDPNLIIKLGSDDLVRVSLPAITVYMFGEEQLYMYYQYLDIVTGKVFCEGVHEYFYKDVVGVTSSQETKKAINRVGLFGIKTVDYLKESIAVVTSGCVHKESYIVPVGNSLLDTNFVGMRNLIRQKKEER